MNFVTFKFYREDYYCFSDPRNKHLKVAVKKMFSQCRKDKLKLIRVEDKSYFTYYVWEKANG